jgi:hypothetical protein
MALTVLATACSDTGDPPTDGRSPQRLPKGSQPIVLDPADFVKAIDHRFWPMTPGSVWVYQEGDQRVEVTVTADTREIEGITATVVHDVVTEGGNVVEDTFDWYAQDVSGTLWYLGEDTKEYEDGKVVSTEGSWEHGVDGALAGVLLPGTLSVGQSYRQEYYAGEAEDNGQIVSTNASARVPFGSFDGCLQTEDTTPLDPEILEHKYYCEGVGLVLAVSVTPDPGREELVSFEAG